MDENNNANFKKDDLTVDEFFTLDKAYEPGKIEQDIYDRWLEAKAFHAVPDERDNTYVIMMPLPNVTGALHMGHAMDNVMQDMLIRWRRMSGDNALWMPGTDHAGIATQAVVEKRLKELENLTRFDVGREGLIQKIWEWKDQYQKRIVSQQQRMGCSADWDRQRFTMDKVCTRAVRHTFFRMYKDGLIFRGKRLINWDPFLQTSISDDEVYHEAVNGHYWYLRYPVVDPAPGDPAAIVVATSRPETMLGDTAVAVHPDPEGALDDKIEQLNAQLQKAPKKERAGIEKEIEETTERRQTMLEQLKHLTAMAREGRQVMLPLLNRPIPLIMDPWAKPEKGSGCVKITPAHDPNDYDVWTRHRDHIDIINILNLDGTLNANAGPYEGMDRFDARKKVVSDLKKQELLERIEDKEIEIGHSDRSKSPIEPFLSDQWFVHMGDRQEGVVMGAGTDKAHTCPGLVQAAIDAANDGRVSFHPERFKKTYLEWLGEKRDWPISRQLWWGHRIPVWSKKLSAEQAQEEIDRVLEKDVAGLLPQKACVRLVCTENDISVLLEDCGDRPELQTAPDEPWRIDVCLLEDDPEGVYFLENLGYEQDPDVLDTWFSSALWPHSTLGWPSPEDADPEGGAFLGSRNGFPDSLATYYPGSCLVTARDIITLWVARMVICGLYNLGDIPFTDVFIHGNIQDGKGERMSKSKGNGIDPVDIIATYGTDAMRYVLCDMQTGNQDIRLPVTAVCPGCQGKNDLAKAKHGSSVFTYMCAHCKEEFDVLGSIPHVPNATLISERFMDGSRFCNKLWNTARFALGHLTETPCKQLSIDDLALEDRWILAALNKAIRAVNKGLEDYNPSAAISAAREFMWGQLCDWYLELIKPRLFSEDPSAADTARQVLAHALDQTLRLLQPFIPYITEFIYGRLASQVPERGLPGLWPIDCSSEMLIKAPWPQAQEKLDDPRLVDVFATLQTVTSGIRDVRSSKGISPGKTLDVTLKPPEKDAAAIAERSHVVKHMANVDQLQVDAQAKQPAGSASIVIGDLQIFVHDVVDAEEEKARLEKELEKVEKEIQICMKKLGNPNFVDKAPVEVVQVQKDRLASYEKQKSVIENSLSELG